MINLQPQTVKSFSGRKLYKLVSYSRKFSRYVINLDPKYLGIGKFLSIRDFRIMHHVSLSDLIQKST